MPLTTSAMRMEMEERMVDQVPPSPETRSISSTILLPNIIDQNARDDPNGVFARIPIGPEYSNGFRDVSKRQLARAINRVAHFIEGNIGRSDDFTSIAYIGPSDLRYSAIAVAGIKTGYKTFLPSPRNSIEAHLALLAKLSCSVLLTTDPAPPCVAQIRKATSLRIITIPSLADLLSDGEVQDYKFDKTYEQAKSDPIIASHTSGSTGIPKPLTYTHEYVSRMINANLLPVPAGYADVSQYTRQGTYFNVMPPFHFAGLYFSLLMPPYHGCVPVYPLPGPPPTTNGFLTAIESTDVDWAMVPPVVLSEIGHDPQLLDRLEARLKYISFAGGAVPKAAGDAVAQRIPIWQALGSSECAAPPLVHPIDNYDNREDWQHICVHPLLQAEWRHEGQGQSELVLKRRPETESFQPVFTLFPDTTEFATRDLFRPHPTKDGLWVHENRRDDIIVFLNGEKTNPISFEETICECNEVKAALVIGAQRFEAAVLIELSRTEVLSDAGKRDVIDRIWPFVQKANAVCPAHAKVSKSKILLVDPEMPMLRASKGTVQRNATLALYADKIDRLYEQEDDESDARDTSETTQPTTTDPRSVIRDVVAQALNWDDIDFFQSGMDSLGALRLQKALKKQGINIALNRIYENSTVSRLAEMVQASSVESKSTGKIDDSVATAGLKAMLDDLRRRVDTISETSWKEKDFSTTRRKQVLLTGSTGAIGSHLLDRLMADPEVERIYCFNRTTDASVRQAKISASHGLQSDFSISGSGNDRVVFVTGDLAKSNFGTSKEMYKTLHENVTHVIHNAWPVNFNLPLTAFQSSLDGVLGLIGFMASANHPISLQLISSISSVSSYPKLEVPEEIIDDSSASSRMGYGQSKYLAERILDFASQKMHLQTSAIRVGQVAGSSKTARGWNSHEWFPSMVITSAHIGALPATIGSSAHEEVDNSVTWVPMDILADALTELCFSSHPDPTPGNTTIFQIQHPKSIPWSNVLETIKSTIQETMQKGVDIVPYAQWLDLVKAQATQTDKLSIAEQEASSARNPAVKLLDFFESLQNGKERGHRDEGDRKRLVMDKTLQSSRVLTDLEPIRHEWIEGWTEDWLSVHN